MEEGLWAVALILVLLKTKMRLFSWPDRGKRYVGNPGASFHGNNAFYTNASSRGNLRKFLFLQQTKKPLPPGVGGNTKDIALITKA